MIKFNSEDLLDEIDDCLRYNDWNNEDRVAQTLETIFNGMNFTISKITGGGEEFYHLRCLDVDFDKRFPIPQPRGAKNDEK